MSCFMGCNVLDIKSVYGYWSFTVWVYAPLIKLIEAYLNVRFWAKYDFSDRKLLK
jgi:hypothetical protein